MMQKDIEALQDPTYIPDSSSGVYIVFMIIGIIGYFTVPTVAGWIIQAGGMGNYGRNVNNTATKSMDKASGAAGAAGGAVVGNIVGRIRGK